MNGTLHLLMESKLQKGAWGGWRAYNLQILEITDQSLSPHSNVKLGLGTKSTLDRVREKWCFCLNFNADVV